MQTDKMRCAYCGREINPLTAIRMELSNKDGLYYREPGIPKNHVSQGWFDIGAGCARILDREHNNPDILPSFDPF